MRKLLIAGNWKMFTNGTGGEALAARIVKELGNDQRVEVAVCPPFPYLPRIAAVVQGSVVQLGAQNMYPESEGAFTGEVSPAMLKDVGCRHVILGHSERRHKLGETNAFINQKVRSALAHDLHVILCIGETLEERERNDTERVLNDQVSHGLKDVPDLSRLVLAYEPVWAIGTGRNATPDQAQQAHAFVRGRIRDLYGEATAQTLRIQYGGSVKPENAGSLLGQPDVDGALVGGASLNADHFLAIVRAGFDKR